MKSKKSLIILFLLGFTQLAFEQQARDVFNPNMPITWLGLDFSQARFIGDHAKFKSVSNTKNLIEALNELMLIEKDKYDIGKMLGKPKILSQSKLILKLDVTQDHNASLDIGALMADSLGGHSHLEQRDIASIVQHYDFKGNTGIGLMFNIETLNKKKSEALIWVTFVNMDTREILFTEKMSQEPGGFGLRNFWAGAVYDMMKRIRKKELKQWQLKYLNK
jgi:hypothetical protein